MNGGIPEISLSMMVTAVMLILFVVLPVLLQDAPVAEQSDEGVEGEQNKLEEAYQQIDFLSEKRQRMQRALWFVVPVIFLGATVFGWTLHESAPDVDAGCPAVPSIYRMEV